ncbi:MAG: hypothetical protein ACI80K_000499 [Paracoccaceae bacterium]|jgi:hypothetical protein
MIFPMGDCPGGLLPTVLIALCSCSGDGVGAEESSSKGQRAARSGDVRMHSTVASLEAAEDVVDEATAGTGKPDVPAGRWFKLRGAADDLKGAAGREDPLKGQGALAGIGYSGAYNESGEFSGAIVYDPDRVEPGLTLFCSGHDTSVLLIDSEGAIVHHWHLDFDEVFPNPLPFETMEFHSEFVRRAWPLPNGDLLAIFEYTGITRVDANGKPLWVLANQSHHDFKVLEDGTIVTLDIERRDLSWMRKHYHTSRFHKGIVDSHVVFLSAKGEVLRKVSIFEAILNSRFAGFLHAISPRLEDIFHANSVDLVDAATAARHSLFEEGDILVSLRNPSAVLAIDGKTEEVKWISQGLSVAQHQASFLSTGSIMLLDNAGGNASFPLKIDQSRVIEIDPETQEILWRYPPLGRDVNFRTEMLGYAERLPGGNTLITESMQGHLLEVSPEGEIVWEYYSPYRAGENDELITTLMGGRRIPRAALPFLGE